MTASGQSPSGTHNAGRFINTVANFKVIYSSSTAFDSSMRKIGFVVSLLGKLDFVLKASSGGEQSGRHSELNTERLSWLQTCKTVLVSVNHKTANLPEVVFVALDFLK